MIYFILFLSEVYEETNTIWFSDYSNEDEYEPMFKLIGVTINRIQYLDRFCLFLRLFVH